MGAFAPVHGKLLAFGHPPTTSRVTLREQSQGTIWTAGNPKKDQLVLLVPRSSETVLKPLEPSIHLENSGGNMGGTYFEHICSRLTWQWTQCCTCRWFPVDCHGFFRWDIKRLDITRGCYSVDLFIFAISVLLVISHSILDIFTYLYTCHVHNVCLTWLNYHIFMDK